MPDDLSAQKAAPRRACAYGDHPAMPGLRHHMGWPVCADHETPEELMTTTDPRTAAAAIIAPDVEQITSALDHLQRVYAVRAMRHENAVQAGVTLAYEVERFLGDPEGVGTDTLREAYSLFMGRHSGGFTDSAMAGDASIDSGD